MLVFARVTSILGLRRRASASARSSSREVSAQARPARPNHVRQPCKPEQEYRRHKRCQDPLPQGTVIGYWPILKHLQGTVANRCGAREIEKAGQNSVAVGDAEDGALDHQHPENANSGWEIPFKDREHTAIQLRFA